MDGLNIRVDVTEKIIMELKNRTLEGHAGGSVG